MAKTPILDRLAPYVVKEIPYQQLPQLTRDRIRDYLLTEALGVAGDLTAYLNFPQHYIPLNAPPSHL